MKHKRKIKCLRKEAEKIFHAWIVRRDKGICITCGKPGNQAGHFRHSKLNFNPINLNCQCMACNHFRHGNLGIYAVKLDDKFGAGTSARLISESWQDENKFSREQLEEIVKKYSVVS
jgi:hypothetical protein